MKYVLGLLVICLLVGVVALQAQNVSVVAETGEFITIPAAAQVSDATNVVATAFTPARAGQLLIGTVSNVVYVAKGTSTNDWLQVTIVE